MDTAKLDYRFLLKNELIRRRRKNPAYSLRALSKKLEISPAYLSQIFSGKRILTESTGFEFAQKLNWSVKKRGLFQNLIMYRRTTKIEVKEAILSSIQDHSELDFLELEQDQFCLVSEWYHFAIVELSAVRGFRSDVVWIAKRLDISTAQAAEAIERLKRIGLLKEKNGKIVRTILPYLIKDVPSVAIKNFHDHNLKAAQLALMRQNFLDRDFSGTTVAIDRNDMPELKDLIKNFRNQLNRFCNKSKTADSVYQLSVQFFRIDKEL